MRARILMALAVTGTIVGCHRAKAPEPENVILVIIDTLRVDHLGLYGHERNTTPHIDELAKKSFVFDRAFSTSSWTRPAIASILSSARPDEHHILSELPEETLAETFVTIPEYFKSNGYVTAGIYTNPHFKFGLEQGIDFRRFKADGSAEWVYSTALKWLKEKRDKPFFLLIHDLDPHDDYKFHGRFPYAPRDSDFRAVRVAFPGSRSGVGKACANKPRWLSGDEIGEMKACYDQEVAYVDYHLGRLIADLEQSGLIKNTIIVVTADHGEEFADHGGYWHGCTLFNELVHVPLIVYAPGHDGGRIDHPVSLLDIFPTLLDLTDTSRDHRPSLSGRSLIPLMNGGSLPPRAQYMATAFRGPLRQAVMSGGFKLIRDARGDHHLFFLPSDPRETYDLAGSRIGNLVIPDLSKLERNYSTSP